MDTQVILLAHGSRDPRWCAVFEQGLAHINRHLSHPARLAYMEMASPSLETVVVEGYAAGERRFVVLPLFFAAGRHLLHDVPEQLKALEASLAGLHIELMEAVGQEPAFWTALGDIVSARLQGQGA